MSFAIVTDSACSLSHTAARDLGLTVLPLSYFVDDVEYPGFLKDGPVDLKGFYEAMRAGAKVRTSLPSLQQSTQAIRSLLEEGSDVLYLGFSSALSGTYDSVLNVCDTLRPEFPERRIVCIETFAASFGEGMLVRKAAFMAKAGATIDEIVSWVEEHRLKMNHWITVDDLSFVLGGGRLGRTGAMAANLLNLKPILRIDDAGAIDVAGKARGRKKSLKAMVDKMKDAFDARLGREVIIAHGDCEDDAKYVEQLIRKEVEDGLECEIHYLDPVIGSHGGPGSMAIFFYGEGR